MRRAHIARLASAGVAAAAAAGAATAGPGGAPFGLGGFGRDEPISIQADQLESREHGSGRRLAFQRDVRVRQGPLELSANALEASYREGQTQPDVLWARGDVRIREGERRAHCREAHYDRLAARIVCRGEPAELWDADDRLFGGEVVFDLERRSVSVASGAELEIHRPRLGPDAGRADGVPDGLIERLRDDGPLSISAARLDARDQDDVRRIAFAGGVVVRQGDVELRSDELWVAYPPEATRPDRLIARGGVVITEGPREAHCARAEYRPAEQHVSCSGGARLRDADDEFEGERIEFDLGRGRVDATGPARLHVDPAAREVHGAR